MPRTTTTPAAVFSRGRVDNAPKAPIILPAHARHTLQRALAVWETEARVAAVETLAKTAGDNAAAALEKYKAVQDARLARATADRDPLFLTVWRALEDARTEGRPLAFA